MDSTQPIVADGKCATALRNCRWFHRRDIGSNRAILKRQLKGYLCYLPVKRAEKSSIAWRQLFVTTARVDAQINAMRQKSCARTGAYGLE